MGLGDNKVPRFVYVACDGSLEVWVLWEKLWHVWEAKTKWASWYSQVHPKFCDRELLGEF